MTSPLRSLISTGTKLWLDSIDPDLVAKNRALGASGATSNPIIIADLIETGRFRPRSRATHRAEAERRADRLAHDRQTGQRCAGRVSSGLGPDAWQRRLCELRARPAAGRSRAGAAARRARRPVHRTGQTVVARTRQPHDEGSGHACRHRRDRAAMRRRRDDQRDADLHAAPVPRGAQRHVARRRAAQGPGQVQERLQHLRVARRRVHREARTAALACGAGIGRHRGGQAHLGREPAVLEGQENCRWTRK